MRPGPGAAACGVQRLGPPGRPGSSGTRKRQRSGGQGPLARRRDLSAPAGPPPPPAAPAAGTTALRLLFSLFSLNFNPKQKHSPPASNASPHWAEPPGPWNAVGRRRGRRRRSARRRRRRRGTAPPPLPGAATTVSPGAAGARRRRESALASQARKPTARRGREVPVSVCICVWEGLRGGCECARARRPVRGKQGICPQSPDPYNPSSGTQPSPAHSALELSAWSSQPPKSCRFCPGSLCWHTRPSRPSNSLPLSLTVALNPKCSRRSLLGAIFLLSPVVSRLGHCWCRRRRCCRRRHSRLRGLHYRVLQGVGLLHGSGG